ncbi:MerR family transcriptional regulator [Lentzea nigeriaca]|uniref:MerR family transcriptional regulator n=1 Tax=Lentzea nigeriaca TaxID=1128665 RepID=UPI0019560EA3|nr:MerR family transcriptional regulator [Lentzea nigeriaca]MBM7860996.1 DNA-binding transcriptional MerR regulator [Lentzea nigeriaca]
MRISELARAAGVGISTVRFYERRGLVVPTARTHGGYRHYDEEALRRLKFIRRAQRLGFTLTELEQLLDVDEFGDVITEKVAQIEERIRDLDRVRLALLEVAENGVQEQCPIIAALNESP